MCLYFFVQPQTPHLGGDLFAKVLFGLSAFGTPSRRVCVWFLCGFNTRSNWQEYVFRFPCALACNRCRRRTSVPGHLSRDPCTTQVLARPGFRFAQVVPSCHEVLPKLLRRQAGSSTSLPLVCLGHVCSACWVTFYGAGVALREYQSGHCC